MKSTETYKKIQNLLEYKIILGNVNDGAVQGELIDSSEGIKRFHSTNWGHNFRYSEKDNTIYWWDYDVSEEDQERAKEYIQNRFRMRVIKHKQMVPSKTKLLTKAEYKVAHTFPTWQSAHGV